MDPKFILDCGQKLLDLSTPRIMGILNLTSDSFYDGGKYTTDSEYLTQTEKMLTDGADIIDIGAVSTRPGSLQISEDEELNLLKQPLQKIKKNFPEALISIDTYRSYVAKKVIQWGAHIINDISGGTFDPEMLSTVAILKVPYVLMHIKGTPQNMQNNPEYEDVVEDVKSFFKLQLNKLTLSGVTNNIVLDPGFGFGKNLEHNYKLLGGIHSLKELEYPLLVGVSRKSMIHQMLNTKPLNALNGTTVINTIALLNGANILRVHDVKEAVQTKLLVNHYKSI